MSFEKLGLRSFYCWWESKSNNWEISCKFQVSLLRLVQKQRIKSKIAEKQVSWKLKTFCFSGVSKLGFPNLGSRPDIENPAFQNLCSNPNWYWNPPKNPFQSANAYGNQLFSKRSQEINIKFPHHRRSEKASMCP